MGDVKAVAWRYKDSDWHEWASITREQFDAYSAMPPSADWQVRALLPESALAALREEVASWRRIAERLEAENARLRELLRRYRNETPLGHQPHMIAHEADQLLAAFTPDSDGGGHG